jgi:hypothetical protein
MIRHIFTALVGFGPWHGIDSLSWGKRLPVGLGTNSCICLIESVYNVPLVYPVGWMSVKSGRRQSIVEAILGVDALYVPLETVFAASVLFNDTRPSDEGVLERSACHMATEKV